MMSARRQHTQWLPAVLPPALAALLCMAAQAEVRAALAVQVGSAVLPRTGSLLAQQPGAMTAVQVGSVVSPRRTEGSAAGASPDRVGLIALLRHAFSNDPEVRGSAALLSAAQDQLVQARSRWWPVLGVQASRGRSRAEASGQGVERKTDRAQASLSWNLYNAGTDEAEVAAKGREAEAAREDLRRVREDVCERIAQAYAQVLRYDDLLPESEVRVRRMQRLHRKVGIQVEAGKLSETDRVQSAATLLDAEIEHGRLESEAEAARMRLAELTGVRGARAIDWPAALSEPPEGDDLASNPAQLAAARLRAEAARSRVSSVASLYAPKVDLQYDHQLHDRTEPRLSEQQRKGWTVTARWDIPLGGEKHARRDESSHRAQAADEEVARVAQSLRAEAAGALDRIRFSRSAIEKLQDQGRRYGALVQAAALQFEAGRRTLVQLTDLEQNSFLVQQRLAEERLQLRTAVLRQWTLSGELLGRLGLDGPDPTQR